MPELCYPVFQEGQTLTRDDLALLSQFFDERAREVGRTIGFGIACGLDGRVTADGLVIEVGVAVDQPGNVITLDGDLLLAFPPPAAATAFDFLAGTDGYTAVLVLHEEETPAPDCDQEGCEGHAATACRTAQIVIAPGRLQVPGFDVLAEPLVAANAPLTANPSAAQFAALRTAILSRLHGRISAAAEAKLAAEAIAGTDLPAIRNHKAAFLNGVLFATLDLLRCEALTNIDCLRTATHPGVALGWLHQIGGAWTWECEWRHAWQPPAGMTTALIGGACDDACRIHRQRIESMILTFELPAVPAPPDPPKDGGGSYVPCRGKGGRGVSKYDILVAWEDCGIKFPPPETIPPDWYVPWGELLPHWPPEPDPLAPWEVYGNPEPDWLDLGLIDLVESYGRDHEAVVPVLTETIKASGGTSSISVVTAAQAAALPGFSPAAAISPSDTVVLVVDAKNKVTMTGSIAAQIAVGGAALAAPAALATANEALQTATTLEQTVGTQATLLDTHTQQLNTFGQQITGLESFQVTAEAGLKGIDEQMTQKADGVLAGYKATIGPLLDGAVLEAVDHVQERFAKDIEQQTGVLAAPLQEQISMLGAQVKESSATAERANVRIDQVLTGASKGLQFNEIGRQTEFNTGMVEFFRTVRGAVEAGATPGQRPKVQSALAAGQDAMDRMEAGVRAGSLVLEDEREALTVVLNSLVGALGAVGAPDAQVQALKEQAAGLQEKLR